MRRILILLLFALSILVIILTCSKKSTKPVLSSSSCSVSPTTLDFDTVPVGNYVAEKSFVIKNNSDDTLSGTIVETCHDFSIASGNANYKLAPIESLIVIIRFQPDSIGNKTCNVETGNSICSNVSCSGTGEMPPSCSVNPSSINFGNVTIGSSVDTNFIIKNEGGGTLNCNVTESCGDFSIFSGSGLHNLTPDQSYTVTVRFTPTSAGNKTCTYETGNGVCADVACSGVGVLAPACSVNPNNIDFGSRPIGSSFDTTFTISNVGGGTLTGNINKGSTMACSDYLIISGQGSFSLSAGESKVVTISFTPSSEINMGACSIETGNNLCNDVVLTGQGRTPTPTCSLSTESLDFGYVPIGGVADQTFTIFNRSNDGSILSGQVYLTLGCYGYSILSGGGTYSLAPGESKQVTIRFGVQYVGNYICTIYPDWVQRHCGDVECIADAYDATPVPTCSLSTTFLDFGTVKVDSMVQKTVTIYNTSKNGAYLSGQVYTFCNIMYFYVLQGGGTYTLAPGESRDVIVSFNPQFDYVYTCDLWLVDPSSECHVNLSGKGKY